MHIVTYINIIIREKEAETTNLTEGIHRRVGGKEGKLCNYTLIFKNN